MRTPRHARSARQQKLLQRHRPADKHVLQIEHTAQQWDDLGACTELALYELTNTTIETVARAMHVSVEDLCRFARPGAATPAWFAAGVVRYLAIQLDDLAGRMADLQATMSAAAERPQLRLVK